MSDTSDSKPGMLDLRRLLGVIFTFYGLVLSIYGLVAKDVVKELSFNLTFWWGLLILIVGLLFLIVSLRPPRTWDPDDDLPE